MDEGVSEGLPSMQSAASAGGHGEDDERYGVVFPLVRLSEPRPLASSLWASG